MVKTVFVVDDEQLIADTLALIVRQHGYQAKSFYSAEAALEAIAQRAPDLIVSDVVMTGMSGIELLLLLRRQQAEIKCILLSGQAQTSILLEDARGRGHHVTALSKPIPPKELLTYIDAALA